MNKGRAFALATLLIVSLPWVAPTGSAGPSLSPSGLTPDSGAGQSFLYVPSAEDAGAFFFRFHTENAACVRFDFNATMDLWAPVPWVYADAYGTTRQVAGMEVDTLGGVTIAPSFDREPGTSHLMANASVVQRYDESGYDERSNRAFQRHISTSCGDSTKPADRWVSILITAPVRNGTVTLSFYEFWAYDDTSPRFDLTEGNATGTVTFAAESNRTFLRELKDFHGTASANGDPLGIGAGPSAAGVNLETTITTTRGFAGGFLDANPRPGNPEISVLSYQGPGGEAGVGTDATPGVPIPNALLLHIAGSAGDWHFRAHAYAAARSFSSLLVWGADIETGTPNPNLDRADADRDGVPDAAEATLCRLQNDNRPTDGECPTPPDYRPPAGTPNPRRL